MPSLKVNQYLKEQLKESYDKLCLSHGLIHRLKKVDVDSCIIGKESFVVDKEAASSIEGSLTLDDSYFTPPSVSSGL